MDSDGKTKNSNQNYAPVTVCAEVKLNLRVFVKYFAGINNENFSFVREFLLSHLTLYRIEYV